MNELNIELLRKLCNDGSVIWSVHAMERIQERGITKTDVTTVINTGKIIEQYPDSFPYPACLILGTDNKENNLHIVIGCNGSIIKIITAYYPNEDKFDSSGEKRKENN